MNEPEGLRTLKKERTRKAIADAAIELFLAEGFDRVSVAEIAARAEVSKPTLFRYFASKEELVLHRIADHQGEAGRVVRDRPAGVSPLAALRQHFLERLAEHDPVSGLNDHPQVLAFYRLVFETPSLSAHLLAHIGADLGALAAALDGSSELTDRLLASQFIAVRQVLTRDNWARLAGGLPMPDAHRQAVADAETAFALLASGAEQYGY
ncbi:TetR family transcriptional regulator [Kitasatospora sp. MAP5-34]|uniref:TetR/AcrR family transcriptional regulator n=1 Tax=Kitasatospora sp. MAP5-34 TaxID=3035102 RepID=UPI0024737477|nr:TetR family transcriptional regulator [Kitasatospora sp. MAP5-34]MDH6575788.1 AcrR family transcriptional regulator [Kitasatospora sp. MAP5-34]